MIKELTLSRLKHASFANEYDIFLRTYKNLFMAEELSINNIEIILSLVVLFSNQREAAMQRLGYRMALLYGNKTNDFLPLYDIAVNTGIIPVVALLRNIRSLPMNEQLKKGDSFISNMVASYIDNFRGSGLVFTEQQFRLNRFFDENIGESTTIIAPTSYGKSELIISAIKKSENTYICILVPSKSLLAQTRKRVLDSKISWVSKIVSHPEMHVPGDTGAIYILTQERLTRILNQDKTMFFNVVIIDEAHNLLAKDGRNVLLASVIRILEFRNKNTAFKFLTPFLKKSSNINIKKSNINSIEYSVSEYVKSELIFLADYTSSPGSVELYDHFTDEYISIKNEFSTPMLYIKEKSSSKNLLYFNRPKHIQEFAKILADALPEIEKNDISYALEEISNSTDENYLLLYCLKHGVLYHHGSMADSLRNYVEHLFRTCKNIKYLVASSTLLEGVNLPIDKMFLLSISKGNGNLKRAQFKNLIGRVNRFSDIFSDETEKSLKNLQPEIHILATNEYIRAGANLHGFCSDVMKVNKKEDDEVENILLDGKDITPENKDEYDGIITRLENLEPGIEDNYSGLSVKTTVGLKLLENNVTEINIFESELKIENVIDEYFKENPLISNSNSLLLLIYNAFVAFIDPNNSTGKNSLIRLKSDKAQTFYAMFLDWSMENAPLTVMIKRFIRYWDNLPEDTPVFVGGWGDTEKDGGHRKSFTFMKAKNYSEKINLAIVRIKEEEDFFNHVIFRFVDILNDLGRIDDEFYLLSKYGSTDKKIILLIKNGFSKTMAETLINEYSRYIKFIGEEKFIINPSIHAELIKRKAGFLKTNEVSLNVMSEN